ncbi:helix-turn-helix domain-containing protein [Streptomyces sp. NPDC056528]|uniref:helix-turn-helix domain-containing protein n=1 Tax=Streptomyces sp. NPDC056528 TaxID=3345854 RepID=UPI0036CA8BDE
MQWSEDTTSERLKALRGAMMQEQLAEAAGVSVGVVRKLERGGTASLPSLLSIADALGTGRSWWGPPPCGLPGPRPPALPAPGVARPRRLWRTR